MISWIDSPVVMSLDGRERTLAEILFTMSLRNQWPSLYERFLSLECSEEGRSDLDLNCRASAVQSICTAWKLTIALAQTSAAHTSFPVAGALAQHRHPRRHSTNTRTVESRLKGRRTAFESGLTFRVSRIPLSTFIRCVPRSSCCCYRIAVVTVVTKISCMIHAPS